MLKEFSSIWHNTIVRGDVNWIEVGRYTDIQDNSVVHVADESPTIIAAGAIVTEGSKIPSYSLVVGVPGKVIKTLPEKIDSIHAQAVKYKTLWTQGYEVLPNTDGEKII